MTTHQARVSVYPALLGYWVDVRIPDAGFRNAFWAFGSRAHALKVGKRRVARFGKAHARARARSRRATANSITVTSEVQA